MSHYAIGVIVNSVSPDDYHNDYVEPVDNYKYTIESMLAYYNEHMYVPQYETECYCSRNKKDKLANEMVMKETGKSIEDLNKEYELRKPFSTIEDADLAWKEISKEYFKIKYEIFKSLPAQKDSDCPECLGTGKYKTMYNPNSKWDYWVIGGRWKDMYPEIDLSTTAIPVKYILDNIDEYSELFGYVLPNIEWVERGKMGWFGIVSDDTEMEDWKQEQKQLLQKYVDGYMVVVVDCHI